MVKADTSKFPIDGNAAEPDLAELILNSRTSKEHVETVLKTDDRVIARVTDGIYRRPGSALRELISNAYDADATEIFIDTDAPRFGTIKITDNGVGMSPAVLARLLEHIGGSSKRTNEGSQIGVASSSDSTVSNTKNRKLIGKIGIGLFSVSQLTQRFQIITKIKGEKYRTIASVVMKTYTEDDLKTIGDTKKFESGRVTIWSEDAEDAESHGTTIILNDLKPQAKDTLRSKDIWATIQESQAEDDGLVALQAPRFHIGHIDANTGELITDTARVPWNLDDDPEQKFKKLVDCVWDQLKHSDPNPKLSELFDYYLQMVWDLSLAAPIPYVNGDPFDIPFGNTVRAFELANSSKKGAPQAVEVDVSSKNSLREAFQIKDDLNKSDKFEIFLDGLKLARPLKFTELPTTTHAIKELLGNIVGR